MQSNQAKELVFHAGVLQRFLTTIIRRLLCFHVPLLYFAFLSNRLCFVYHSFLKVKRVLSS